MVELSGNRRSTRPDTVPSQLFCEVQKRSVKCIELQKRCSQWLLKQFYETLYSNNDWLGSVNVFPSPKTFQTCYAWPFLLPKNTLVYKFQQSQAVKTIFHCFLHVYRISHQWRNTIQTMQYFDSFLWVLLTQDFNSTLYISFSKNKQATFSTIRFCKWFRVFPAISTSNRND